MINNNNINYLEIAAPDVINMIYDDLNTKSKIQFSSTDQFFYTRFKAERIKLLKSFYEELRKEIQNLNQQKEQVLSKMVNLGTQLNQLKQQKEYFEQEDSRDYSRSWIPEAKKAFFATIEGPLERIEQEKEAASTELGLILESIKRKQQIGQKIANIYKSIIHANKAIKK